MKTSRILLLIAVLGMVSSMALAGLERVRPPENTHSQLSSAPIIRNASTLITLGWSQQTSGITTNLYSVKAVSQMVAWVGAAGPNVLRTTNGGVTWTGASVTGITGDVYAVEARGPDTAWVTTSPGATFIYRTTDGGASWTQVYTLTGTGAFIDAIHMFDSNNGIALGDPVGGKWTVVRTTDAGATWVRDLVNAPPQAGTEAGSNNGLAAVDANHIWFTSNSVPPRVYRTTDGGTTWASSTVPGTSTFNEGISFFNTQLGLVGGNSGELVRTIDGGATWTPIAAGNGGAVYGISTSGIRDAWMNQAASLWHSGDKGVTWDSVYSNGTGQLVNHMSFVTYGDSTSGWTAGASGTIAAFYGALSPPPPGNDIRPSLIVTPFVHTKHHAAFNPVAMFLNAGSAPQTGIPVRFQILDPNGSIVYNVASIYTGTLGVEQEDSVTFSSFSIPVTTGSYTARAISQNNDANPSNDTLAVTFYIPNNLSGTYTVGSGGNLSTMKAAVDTLSRNDVAGPITFSLISANYTEPPLLIENVSYATAPQPVTIKPALGVSPHVFVTGAASGDGLTIVNSANIVIQGSNAAVNPNSLDWTLEVDSTSAVARNGITMTDVKNVTIQNLKIKGYYNPGVSSATCIAIGTVFGNYNMNVLIDHVEMSRCFKALDHAGAGGSLRDSNITVSNCTIGTVLGSFVFNTGLSLQNVEAAVIYNNVLNGVNYGAPAYAGSGDAFGVELQSARHSKVYNNKISNIANTGTGSNAYRVTALAVLGEAPGVTSSNSIFNNMIWDVRTTSTSPGASVQGIWVSNGAGDSVYYNSVYLGGTTATNIYSAAFQLEASSCRVLNNVFYNNQTDGTIGRSIAIFKSSTAGTSVLTSNNNVFFAPQVTGKLGAVDTANYTTLLGPGSWNAATGQDALSRQGNPRFLSATDLHISTTVRTPVESAGTPIAGFDIDGDPRNPTTPDAGADEGNFLTQIPNDMQTVSIDNPVAGLPKKVGVAFSPLATFTNTGSVNQSSIPVRFRIYDAGNLTTPLFDLTSTISSLVSGGVSQVTFTPAVTINTPGNYVAKAISELASDGDRSTDTVTLAFKVKNSLAGAYNIPGADYTTIDDAVNDLRAVGISSSVTFLLGNQTFTETIPLVIDTISGSSAVNTVTFKPAPGATPTITGDIANNALFTFNGCDYVTFDGSNTVGGTTQDLTVSNTTSSTSGTGAPVFWIHHIALVPSGVDVAKKNTIKNCRISGGVNQSTAVNTIYGILMSGSPLAIPPPAGAANDSNTFTNNVITKVRVGIALYGATGVVYTRGTVIADNVIGPASFGSDQIGRAGILTIGRCDGTTITHNVVRYVGGSFAGTPDPGTSTAVFDRIGIGLGSETWPPTATAMINSSVTRNLVHDIVDERGNSAAGITVAGSGSSANTIANNMIYLVRSNGSLAGKQSVGIGISSGNSDKVVYNSISMTGVLDPGGVAAAGQSAVGIRISVTTPSSLTLKDNIVSVNISSSTTSLKHYAIVAPAATYNWGTGGSNYNVLDANAGNPQMVLGGIGTTVPYTDKTTLAAWRTTFVPNQDLNSVTGDPLFTSATDLHITNNASPASNAGIPIAGITTDLDGDTRNVSTPDIGADEFAASTVTVNTGITTGWNMISNPLTNPVPDDSAKHLFPTIVSRAFRFSNGYVPSDTMHNGVGYWGKFPGAVTNAMTGSARTRDTITVVAGWNMVGSISNPVDTATIVQIPGGIKASNWFGFVAGYAATSPIVPGKAYWVKAGAAGKFVFANPLGAGAAKAQTPTAQSGAVVSLDALNTVTITDSKGGSQTLYFGADAKNEIPLPLFDMPPAPPVGALDARFETSSGGSMVRTHQVKVSGPVEFPVKIQSDAYPVTVTWKINGGTASYEMTDGVAGKVFHAKDMTGEGSIKIVNSEVNRVVVKLVGDGTLPADYALSQNYPNPFNPTTSVKYALPVQSRVTINIYNVLGQRVRTLINDDIAAGYHTAEWDGKGNNGQQIASGTYFLQLSAQGTNGKSFNEIRKLLLLK